jgi:Protein of unknown function (DUF4232)
MHLLTRSPRGLIGAAAIACAAALIPGVALAATSSPASRAATATTPACATSGLVVWLDVPAGNGYAGGAYFYLKFTNLSGHVCTLHGSPGVSAVTLSGHQLGSPAHGDYTGSPSVVVLGSGATATAKLQIADPADFGNSCLLSGSTPAPGNPGQLPTAAGLRVYPPNQLKSKVVPYPFSACAHTGPVWIGVGPVTAGGPPE